MRARPETICSTSCFSVASDSVVCSIFSFNWFPAFRADSNVFMGDSPARSRSSMRHGVKNNVDRERVGDFLGEMLEVIVIVAFPFPAVAVVGVVRGNHHDAPLVVENGAVVHFGCVRTFPGTMLRVELTLGAQVNVGYLVLGFDVENATVERMIQGQLHEVAVGENLFQLPGHARPLALAPE